MAFSQNGWPVLQQYGGPLVSNTIPGTGLHFLGGVLGGDVDLVLRYVGARWHREIEPIVGPADKTGLWGYNFRPIRGQSSGFSNHASGTAVDINSAKHPLGTKTLTSAQKAALKRIESDLDGVIRFGAFYSGRADEMHAEAAGSAAALARIATRIRNGQVPNVPNEMLTGEVPKKPLPPTPPTPGKNGFNMDDAEIIRRFEQVKQEANEHAQDIEERLQLLQNALFSDPDHSMRLQLDAVINGLIRLGGIPN